MPRFISNRWWVFILALCVTCSAPIAFTPSASASTYYSGDVGGSPGTPSGYGDPDAPSGSSAKAQQSGNWGYGVSESPVTALSAGPAGDGHAAESVWMWRLQIILESFRSFYFRF